VDPHAQLGPAPHHLGERARDGDYALNDLDAVRSNPFQVARDYEGHTDRDLMQTAILARHEANTSRSRAPPAS
jgi:hypothetical protein